MATQRQLATVDPAERDKILAIAAMVLKHTRLDGYTTNAISETGGFSMRSIGRHVGDIDNATRGLVAQVRASVLIHSDGIAGNDQFNDLKAIIRAVLSVYSDDPLLIELLLIEEKRLQLSEGVSIEGAIRGRLRDLLSHPHPIRHEVPELAYRYICGIISRMALEAALFDQRSAPAAAGRIFSATYAYWNGLRLGGRFPI